MLIFLTARRFNALPNASDTSGALSIKQIAILCLLALSPRVDAALIEVDYLVDGDNLVTFDTDSGLEWLDVTESMGMSYDIVNQQFGTGGVFDGWRYAHAFEIEQLWTSAGGDASEYYTGWNAANDGLTEALGTYVGFTRLDMTGFLNSKEIFAIMADTVDSGNHQISLLWNHEGVQQDGE